ncbi:LANO_0H02278g1_1 [Lachancea nothofagi CBS 11611]|uniref:U1 small nuclear ribonucleoprotein component SNU71 n=1 Tax=Lachancea nothofagi CBS 11611 TaxID=1266666 RepID=A0A1G4KKV9_9SACH|nr:LANO_0H02278g1_1 [Lachancea nothofagi CBS 11611]
MDSMVYVCPSAYLSSQTTELWHSETFKPGFVPILRTDLLKFRDVLDKVVLTVNQERAAHAYQTSNQEEQNAVKEIANVERRNDGEKSSLDKFQDLKQFLPISVDQQLCTISIENFQGNLTQDQLAHFVKQLDELTTQSTRTPNALECWTVLKGLDTFTLFLRCAALEQLPILIEYWTLMFKQWSEDDTSIKPQLHYDENTDRYCKDHTTKSFELESTYITKDALHLSNQLQEFRDNAAVATDEIQSVDYKVDISTLSDLPRSSLEQLCKDIIHFRTRVVTIEKEKRAKAEYEENKRMGQHMMQVFDQIRRSKGNADSMDDEDGSELNGGGDEAEDEEDEEDDLIVEKRKEEQREKEEDMLYNELLGHYTSKVEVRFRSLQEQVAREKAYESNLEQERPLYLKELLHLAYSPYYDHHRSYKDEELRHDDEDRIMHGIAEAAEEQKPDIEQIPSTSEPSKFKLKIGKPQEEEGTLVQSDDDLANLIGKLRDSNVVQELVIEFLGESDDDLTQYIFDHLKEHRSRKALLGELRETFDDDADMIVERIWEKLETLG